MTRTTNVVLAGLAIGVSLALIGLTFREFGTPEVRRRLEHDSRRIDRMSEISREINQFVRRNPRKGLAENLGDMGVDVAEDAELRRAVTYRRVSKNKYQLCSDFLMTEEEAARLEDRPIKPKNRRIPGQACLNFTADPDEF